MSASHLTFERRLIQPAAAPESKPGHTLVVFEETTRGRRLFQVVAPGATFKAPFLRFGAAYVAYHVVADERLLLEWVRSCTTLDQKHAFDLHLGFGYRVRNPGLLVENMDVDPLHKVQRHMEVQVLARLHHLAWDAIREGALAFKSALQDRVPNESGLLATCLEELQVFGAAYGLEIARIFIERTLPEDELIVARDEVSRENQRGLAKNEVETQLVVGEMKAKMESELSAKMALLEIESADLRLRLEEQRIAGEREVEAMKAAAARELEKRRLEFEHELNLKMAEIEREELKARIPLDLEKQRHEQALKLRNLADSVTEVVKGMLERSGNRIDSFPEMGRALRNMAEIRDMAGQLFFGQAGAQSVPLSREQAFPHGTGVMNRGEFAATLEPLVGLLISLCDCFARYAPGVRCPVLSCSLHLIAIAIRKHELSSGLGDSCRAQIQELLGAKSFERDEIRLLREVANPTALAERLEVILERD